MESLLVVAKVLAIVSGAPKLAPPFVDLATTMFRLPSASGQKTKTSPKLFVLMSPPIPTTVVSAPLTCTGACHVPPAPAVRRATKTGRPLCQVT